MMLKSIRQRVESLEAACERRNEKVVREPGETEAGYLGRLARKQHGEDRLLIALRQSNSPQPDSGEDLSNDKAA